MKRLAFCAATLLLATIEFAQAANPVPFLDQPLAPSRVNPGAPAFILTLHGTGFVLGSSVEWSGRALPTTFVNAKTLTAKVPRIEITKAATILVSVVNPGPGGGTSNVAYFEVTKATPTAILFGNRMLTPSAVNAIVAGDFNRDGKLDIAASTGTTISMLLGSGDGTFNVNTFTTSAQFVGTLATGDFNGDNELDLAFVDPLANVVQFLAGAGDGTFTEVSSTSVGAHPVSLLAADFNSDGNLDLAVVNQSDDTASILLGKGDGSFLANGAVKVGARPSAAAVADIDSDGNCDIAVVSTDGNKVSILLGHGDGTFSLKSSPATQVHPVAIVATDLNRDGKIDLAVINNCGNDPKCHSYGSVTVLLGAGDGTFQASSKVLTGYNLPQSIAAADFNADGKVDLVVGGVSETMGLILLGNGKGGFQKYPVLGPINASGESIAVGDFNGDGRLDYAANNNINVGGMLSVTFAWQSPVAFYPAVLKFPPQPVGTTSSPKTVKFSNVGPIAINISKVAVVGYFAGTNDCPARLEVGTSCKVTITFTPGFQGLTGGSVVVTDDALGITQTSSLVGRGT